MNAFKDLLVETRPVSLQTGLEILNRPLQSVLKELGIHHFSTHTEETKASIVERFNRTLKTRMWRYFMKRQMLRYLEHRHGTGESQRGEPGGCMVALVRQRGRQGKLKLRVRDRVRSSKVKRMFKKSFDNVQYVPVLCKDFITVENDIRDDAGRPVPFERGKVTATLHFRRRETA